MAKTTTAPVTQTLQTPITTFQNADGAVGTTLTNSPSNSKLHFTASSEGSVLKSMIVTSDDTSARVLVIYISTDGGTTKTPLCAVNIPTLSGQSGTIAAIDILGSTLLPGMVIDQSGKPVLPLTANARIYLGVQVAITSAKFLNIVSQAEDFI